MDNPYQLILWYVWTFHRIVDIPPLWMFHPTEIFMTLEYPQMLAMDFPVKFQKQKLRTFVFINPLFSISISKTFVIVRKSTPQGHRPSQRTLL